VHEERAEVEQWSARGRRAVLSRVESERRALVSLRSRPVLADPTSMVTTRRRDVSSLQERSTRRLHAQIHRARDQVVHTRSQIRALSPLSTLERGYAVVQHQDGRIVQGQVDVEPQELLRVRVARGDFGVRVVGG
jgi:exodeoxyribonuclease VII large subunit